MTALAAGSLAVVLPRQYESSTRIFIDPRGLQVMDKDITSRSATGEQGTLLVESEMRVLTSDNVLRAVMEHARLADDPEFNGSRRTIGRLVERFRAFSKSLVGLIEEPTPPDLEALRYLQRSIKVRREPQSYVVDLSVTTRDSGKSQALADRIALEYVQTRFTSQASATQRASDTMSGRLDELRKAVVMAEDAVEQFKAQNNIVGASGRLVNEQQLADQIARIRRTGAEADAVPEALRSETLSRLRTQYTAIRRREASLSGNLLRSHPQLQQVARELADTKRLISEELARIAENARLDAERARSNERQLEKSFEDLKRLASTTNEKTVRLRQLEREAEAHRSVYSTFLTRSRELAEQKKIDTALATVLSPAILPRDPKPPTLLHLLALGALAGLGLGLHNALRLVRADPRVRNLAQLRAIVGSRHICVIDGLSEAVRRHNRVAAPPRKPGETEVPTFVMTAPEAATSTLMVWLAAELAARTSDGRRPIMLVTAAGDYEGKSTVAVNLALAAARTGNDVLLIDADQRGLSATKLARTSDDAAGFLDVAAGQADADNAIVKQRALPIDIVPAGSTANLRKANIGSALIALARSYGVVVIDAGVPIRDRLAIDLANHATHVLLVAREDVTIKAEYQSALEILDRGGRVQPVLLTDR